MAKVLLAVRYTLSFCLLTFFVAACGGGGSRPQPTPTATPTATPTPTPDSVPAEFSFPAAENQARDVLVESTAVTISDIEVAAELSISGGEYAIDGGDFASAASTIENGQSVVVRGQSSSDFATSTIVTLTIGGLASDFIITTLARDDEPESFAPSAAQLDLPIASEFTFDAFTITGINDAVDITIEGATATYSINGSGFTSSAATVNAGDSVQVRVPAANTFATTSQATLTIGSVQGVFAVTTEAEDTTPESFNLGVNATSSTPGEWKESEVITVTGINSAAAISVANGEFKIVGSDDYPSSATTVTEGQQIQVRVQSGSNANETQTATLNIGGVLGTFAVATTDSTPPTANVQFPTPNTLSDGTYVTIRGQAQDDFGPVTTINVVVTTDDGVTEVDNQILTAEAGDNFQTTWSQRVNLAANKVNTITVTATDDAGNVQSTPQVLMVTQSAMPINFPEGENVYIGEHSTKGMGWDEIVGRLLIPNASGEIIAVDTATGDRELYFNFNEVALSPNPQSISVLGGEGKVLVGDSGEPAIYIGNSVNPVFTMLSETGTSGLNAPISVPNGLKQHSDGLVYVVDREYLYTVDLQTGVRNSISSPTQPEGGENLFQGPRSLCLDEANNRALVSDSIAKQVLSVDLSTGARTPMELSVDLSAPWFVELIDEENYAVILDLDISTPSVIGDIGSGALVKFDIVSGEASILSDDETPNANNSFGYPTSLVVDRDQSLAYVAAVKAFISDETFVRVVDLTTGERVTLSYSPSEF